MWPLQTLYQDGQFWVALDNEGLAQNSGEVDQGLGVGVNSISLFSRIFSDKDFLNILCVIWIA